MHLPALPHLLAVASLRDGLLALAVVAACFASSSARADTGAKPVKNELDTPIAQASTELASADNGLASADLERARSLFQRGVEFASRDDYVSAAKRFREALTIHAAPAVAYNLASALFELGQHTEAYDLVQSVLRDTTTPEALRTRAQRLEASLQRNVARLTVIVSSEESDISVQIDGEPLAKGLVGVTRAVPPGEHVVLAERGGVRISERSVRIPSGTAALVDVSLVMTPQQAAEAENDAAAPSLPVVSEPRHDDNPDPKKRRRLWIILGASAAAVGAGVALAIVLAKPETKTERPVAGDSMPGVLVWK